MLTKRSEVERPHHCCDSFHLHDDKEWEKTTDQLRSDVCKITSVAQASNEVKVKKCKLVRSITLLFLLTSSALKDNLLPYTVQCSSQIAEL